MNEQVRIEIKGRDEFWGRAFHVEWRHQFPARELVRAGKDSLLAEADWLSDIERVAAETFCTVARAPENPRRREWLSSIVARRGRG
jgi:hypothetical protein